MFEILHDDFLLNSECYHETLTKPSSNHPEAIMYFRPIETIVSFIDVGKRSLINRVTLTRLCLLNIPLVNIVEFSTCDR